MKGRKERRKRLREGGDKDLKKKSSRQNFGLSFSFLRAEASKALENDTTRWEEPGSPDQQML